MSGRSESIEFDVLTEAVNDLKKVLTELREVRHDPRAWKWVIIAMHNCLQQFMVSALEAGNGLATLTARSREKWFAWSKNPADPPPREIQATFEDLYETVKQTQAPMHHRVDSRAVQATPEQDASVARLNRLRDHFVHFPASLTWFLETSGLPQTILDALDIAHFTAFESMNVPWPPGEGFDEEAYSLFAQVRQELIALAVAT